MKKYIVEMGLLNIKLMYGFFRFDIKRIDTITLTNHINLVIGVLHNHKMSNHMKVGIINNINNENSMAEFSMNPHKAYLTIDNKHNSHSSIKIILNKI